MAAVALCPATVWQHAINIKGPVTFRIKCFLKGSHPGPRKFPEAMKVLVASHTGDA